MLLNREARRAQPSRLWPTVGFFLFCGLLACVLWLVFAAQRAAQIYRANTTSIASRIDETQKSLNDLKRGLAVVGTDVRFETVDQAVQRVMTAMGSGAEIANNLQFRTMRQLGRRGFVLVLGDRIAASAPLPETVCGRPVVNFAAGGARVTSFLGVADEMVYEDIVPDLTLLAVGVNDARLQFSKRFSKAYDMLVSSLPDGRVVAASLAPVAFDGSEAKKLSQPGYWDVDTEIRSLARRRSVPLIDLKLLADDPALQTTDGLHFNPYSSRRWAELVTARLKEILGCT